ncbi:unnamed protein product, partial [Medioppia subpectinata]
IPELSLPVITGYYQSLQTNTYIGSYSLTFLSLSPNIHVWGITSDRFPIFAIPVQSNTGRTKRNKLTAGEMANVNQQFSKTIPKVTQDFKAAFDKDFKQGLNVSTYGVNTNKDCWVCSSPCSMIYCCNDGYPQCCIVGGYCACCSH